jgi:predicted O-methyltransferase YrrM
MFSLALLIVVIFSAVTIVFYTLRNGISPMPTGGRVNRVVLDVLSDVNPNGRIVELGSGWGTLALGIGKRLPKCSVVGYENSPVPYFVSHLLRVVLVGANVVFDRVDFYRVALSGFDVAVCYLYPGAMEKLREKFASELRPGTLVVSHTFAVPGWEPERVVEVSDLYRTKVYVYRV